MGSWGILQYHSGTKGNMIRNIRLHPPRPLTSHSAIYISPEHADASDEDVELKVAHHLQRHPGQGLAVGPRVGGVGFRV